MAMVAVWGGDEAAAAAADTPAEVQAVQVQGLVELIARLRRGDDSGSAPPKVAPADDVRAPVLPAAASTTASG
jgi:hypothetical protein